MLLKIMWLESATQKRAAKKGDVKNEGYIRDVIENTRRKNVCFPLGHDIDENKVVIPTMPGCSANKRSCWSSGPSAEGGGNQVRGQNFEVQSHGLGSSQDLWSWLDKEDYECRVSGTESVMPS